MPHLNEIDPELDFIFDDESTLQSSAEELNFDDFFADSLLEGNHNQPPYATITPNLATPEFDFLVDHEPILQNATEELSFDDLADLLLGADQNQPTYAMITPHLPNNEFDFFVDDESIRHNATEELSFDDLLADSLLVGNQNQPPFTSKTAHYKAYKDLLDEREMHQLVAYFKLALNSNNSYAIKSIWHNKLFASYFSGQQINVKVSNAQGEFQRQSLQLKMPEIVDHFKAALASQSEHIINSIWKKNKLLASYFSGQKIQLPVFETQGHFQPQTMQLTTPDLIANFEAALTSRCPKIINSMWGSENSPLQSAIKTLNDEELADLTIKVRCSTPSGAGPFIRRFLKSVSSEELKVSRYGRLLNQHGIFSSSSNKQVRDENMATEDEYLAPFKRARVESHGHC